MKKLEPAIRIIATGTLFLLLLTGLLIGTFFLTAWLYHTIGHAPPPFLVQVINSLLGVALYAVILIGFFSLINARQGVRRRQMGLFEPIFAAMEQIAKGDFQVRLNPPLRANVFASELAKSVNQMALELNQMEHLRQEFISNVSHEIQSPLTSIRGFAQALHDEQLSAQDRHHYLTIIETESMRLSRMTDNMLKLASLESKHVKVEPTLYRLDKQIRTLILACEPQWTSKTLDMDVALEEVEILADEDLLSQVWSNLLHNSIKFTPEGGRVCVEVHRRGSHIECRFTDTGMGIPEEAQAHVFERFYKVDQSRERSNAGSGLGLAIAKKIVELHQGTIGVASQPGIGTTVIVSLPVE
jgi:two-component system, OmpR family, phosphate regulon sensor histidine kinase PhoR